MNIVPVDYNATTPDGGLYLGFPDTQAALQAQGVGPGDGIWASDSEVLVGAVLENDPIDGLVAVPHWKTIVHLDDYTPTDFERVRSDLTKFLQRPPRKEGDGGELFRLITVLHHIGPAGWADTMDLVKLSSLAANSLYMLNELELTLLTLREALPCKSEGIEVCYFAVLHQLDPAAARKEAERRATDIEIYSLTLAICIDIIATASYEASDSDFDRLGLKILNWIERFDHSAGRDQVPASVLARVQFTLGLVLLRLGRIEEAGEAFRTARAIDPTEPVIQEALSLKIFDNSARELAARFRAKSKVMAA